MERPTRPPATAAPGPGARLLRVLPVAFLLALQCLLAVTAGYHHSPFYDEPAHIVAGYAYWTMGDYRLHPENGSLSQRILALPAVLSGNFTFPSTDQDAWRRSDKDTIARQFLYGSGNDERSLLRSSRAAVAAAGLLLGLLVWRWSRALFGEGGGLLSLALYALCPSFLAHNGIATSDTILSLALLAATGAAWRLTRRVTPSSVLLFGLGAAALLLVKASGLLILPIAVLLAAWRVFGKETLTVHLPRRRLETSGAPRKAAWMAGAFLAAGLIAWGTVWGAYGFRYAAMSPAATRGGDTLFVPWDTLEGHGLPTAAARFAREHRLLPEGWLYGTLYAVESSSARAAFLNGRSSIHGWPLFFPYAFLAKTPLTTLALLAAAATLTLAAVRRREAPPAGPPWRTLPLWLIIAVYGAAAVASHLNIGHRHILPLYPAAYVLAGGFVPLASRRGRRMAGALAAAAVCLLALESLPLWPSHLAFFNRLAGGPENGWRHLVDSSLDWGQDLPALNQWLRGNAGEGEPVFLSYFGTGDPASYGVRALDPAASPGLAPGVYAISATMLQQVYAVTPGRWCVPYEEAWRHYAALAEAAPHPSAMRPEDLSSYLNLRFGRLCAFLRHREPLAQPGYSILVWRLDDAGLLEALEGPPPELLPGPETVPFSPIDWVGARGR